MDFTVIERAGLRLTEFSKLVGVSRTAIYSYLDGVSKPNRLTEQRLTHVLSALSHMVEAGALPRKITRLGRTRFIEELRGQIDPPPAYR